MDGLQRAGAKPGEERARTAAEARILQHVSAQLNSTLDLDGILEIALATMDELFGFRHSLILLLDDTEENLVVAACRGYPEPPTGAKVKVGTGLIGVVAKRKRTMRFSNLASHHAYAARIRAELNQAGGESDLEQIPPLPGLANAQSQLAIPLLIEDRLIGVFSVESQEQRVFSEQDEVLISIVANQAASAIHNARLYKAETQRRQALIEAHERLNPALIGLARSKALAGDAPEAFLQEVTETVAGAVDVERCSIWTYSRDPGAIRMVDLFQKSSREHSADLALAQSDFPQYFQSLGEDRAIAADDAHTDPRTAEFSASYLTPLGITSMLDAPIHLAGDMIGVICLEHVGEPRRWTPEEQSFCASVADLIALAIEGYRRRHALGALRKSENRYRALAENFPNGSVVLFDHDLRYIVADGRDLQGVGLTQEAEGKTIWEALPAETTAVVEPHYRRALAGEESVFELEVAGQLYEMHALPVRDTDGRVAAGMVMAQNITERKRSERLLEEYSRTLEEKVEARTLELRENQTQLVQSAKMAALGSLAAGLAHEINTPLGAIVGNSDVTRRLAVRIKNVLQNWDEIETDARLATILELLQSIEDIEKHSRTAGARITRIVSSLRTFAHLDQGTVDEVDLHEGIESTLALLQHRFKDRIAVHKQFAPIPRIQCSPAEVNQVFMNLLLNAVEAIEGAGNITIRTSLQDGAIVVEIADDGVGIPRQDLQRIFDPGFTTKGVKIGAGLGLSIAFRIVESLGGRIEVESEPEQGSRFRILLAASAKAADRAPVALTRRREAG